MRTFITHIFEFLLALTLFITCIVGLVWLFDYKPNNLYLVWRYCYNSLAVSFLFYLLFGEK